MIQIQIEEGLMLDTLIVQDAPQLFSIVDANRAYLDEFLPWVKHTNEVSDSEKFITENATSIEQNTALSLCIKKEGEIVGVIGFNKIQDDFGEIGYWISQEYEGQGIITKACEAIEEYGFDELNLKKIQICTEISNQKSERIPQKLGYELKDTIIKKEEDKDYNIKIFVKEKI